MPGLAELTYTTLGGVVGAAASNYFTKHHERRQLRAAVMDRVHAMTAITAGVRDIELGWTPVSRTADGRLRLTSELGIKAALDGGADAEPAQRGRPAPPHAVASHRPGRVHARRPARAAGDALTP